MSTKSETSHHYETKHPGRHPEVMVLAGGGIDSTVLIAMYRKRNNTVTAIHYDYGHPAQTGELRSLRRLSVKYDFKLLTRSIRARIARIDDEFLCRNALFILSAAAEFGGRGQRLAIGAHSQAPYYDCSPEFFVLMRSLLDGHFGGRVTLEVPLQDFTKSDIVALGRKMRVPLSWTHSCTRARTPCGKCPSCLDREALGV